ncbi:MAG: hypothetical protein IT167_19100 [Bryobacterales bacterium]|nr:hypothetical protein [Bryobacterales bacterium]
MDSTDGATGRLPASTANKDQYQEATQRESGGQDYLRRNKPLPIEQDHGGRIGDHHAEFCLERRLHASLAGSSYDTDTVTHMVASKTCPYTASGEREIHRIRDGLAIVEEKVFAPRVLTEGNHSTFDQGRDAKFGNGLELVDAPGKRRRRLGVVESCEFDHTEDGQSSAMGNDSTHLKFVPWGDMFEHEIRRFEHEPATARIADRHLGVIAEQNGLQSHGSPKDRGRSFIFR